MTVRTSFHTGSPVWIDLDTSDPERARAFYAALFGWEFEEGGPEYGGYAQITKDGHQIGGIMPHQGDGPADMWSVYLAVTDANAAAARVATAGGQVIVEPMEIPGMGRFAFFLDPAGGGIGAWQAAGLNGFDLEEVHGAPAWCEEMNGDFRRSLDFYRHVFDWDVDLMSDTDDFRYARHMVGDEPQAGIMDAARYLPDGAPSAWYVYFLVDDADAAVATVVEHGGTVVKEPEESGFGRLAVVRDPLGAEMKIVARNAEGQERITT